MTAQDPQRGTIAGIGFKVCREAIVLEPYPDGTYKTGPLAGQPKHSQAGGSQTNYGVDPPREVRADDPPITLREALRWSLIGISARERDVNNALTVEIAAPRFDAMCCCYYQKGNVRRPLAGEPPDRPTGPTFLEEVGGLFSGGHDVEAIAAFMLFNSGANNVPTLGHTLRRAKEIGVCGGDYGSQQTYPFFPTGELTKANRQERPVQELLDILRDLDPTRAP